MLWVVKWVFPYASGLHVSKNEMCIKNISVALKGIQSTNLKENGSGGITPNRHKVGLQVPITNNPQF